MGNKITPANISNEFEASYKRMMKKPLVFSLSPPIRKFPDGPIYPEGMDFGVLDEDPKHHFPRLD